MPDPSGGALLAEKTSEITQRDSVSLTHALGHNLDKLIQYRPNLRLVEPGKLGKTAYDLHLGHGLSPRERLPCLIELLSKYKQMRNPHAINLFHTLQNGADS